MSFLWDSNILRHYLDDHPLLMENLKKVPRRDVMLPNSRHQEHHRLSRFTTRAATAKLD